MPGCGRDQLEELEPSRRILNRPTQILERTHQPIESSEVWMIGCLNIQPVELPPALVSIPRAERAGDTVGQGHDRIVEEQIHLRCALRGQVATADEAMQLGISADPQRLVCSPHRLSPPRKKLLRLLDQPYAARISRGPL